MIIYGFGASASSCVFPQNLAQDDWQTTRPAVTATTWGMSGAYDFYHTDSYPLGPLMVKKRMLVRGTSWANVETQLDTLAAATIMAGESKLWGLQRDMTTTVWAYAKCTRFAVMEGAKNPKTAVPVEMEFFCREGIWYGGGEVSQQYATVGVKTLANAGIGAAQVRLELTNTTTGSNPTITYVEANNTTTSEGWSFGGDIAEGSELIVDSGSKTCTLDGSAAYADLTVFGTMVNWLSLAPGNNSITVTITPNTGIFSYTFYWTTQS
jgi:hypothetical protein